MSVQVKVVRSSLGSSWRVVLVVGDHTFDDGMWYFDEARAQAIAVGLRATLAGPMQQALQVIEHHQFVMEQLGDWTRQAVWARLIEDLVVQGSPEHIRLVVPYGTVGRLHNTGIYDPNLATITFPINGDPVRIKDIDGRLVQEWWDVAGLTDRPAHWHSRFGWCPHCKRVADHTPWAKAASEPTKL